MNFKLHILRSKIHLFSRTGKIGKLASRMKIAREGNTVKNILLCFPVDEPSFRVAAYSFRKFGDTVLKDIQIVLLIPNQYRKLLHFRFGQVITYDYNSEKNVIITLNEIRKIVKEIDFDMIIDLNPSFNLTISQFISNISAKYKVGFRSEFSDWFYNIQFNLSKTGFLEQEYHKINTLLTTT